MHNNTAGTYNSFAGTTLYRKRIGSWSSERVIMQGQAVRLQQEWSGAVMVAAKRNTFRKMVLIIFLLLLPIACVYMYSHQVSINVLRSEIQGNLLNRQQFFISQVDAAVDQLAMFPVIVGHDPFIREYVGKKYNTQLDKLLLQSRVIEKLGYQSASSEWTNELNIYLAEEKQVLSSNIFVTYNDDYMKQPIKSDWTYDQGRGKPLFDSFVRQISEPASTPRLEQAHALYEVRFSAENLRLMLDHFKAGGNGDPFLYVPGMAGIYNHSVTSHLAATVAQQLDKQTIEAQSGNRILELDSNKYLINFVKSNTLGWYLVDYVPLEQTLLPITKSRNFFYVVISLLLVAGMVAAYLLYRHVQKPIAKLLQGVLLLKSGIYSARIDYQPNNEFDFLIRRFNEMAEEIQELIEKVYAEQLRSREATLKQLQAQINPHFLYNCLYFISNMAMLEDKQSVVAMANNLGDYYRYTTRVEKQLVTIREELQLITNYLTIQNLRMERVCYEIEVPEAILSMTIPRLLLQPLVENAVIHGLERKAGKGLIRISGESDGTEHRIVIEDNGVGVTEAQMNELRQTLDEPMSEQMGCGVWNVHQRLRHYFGPDSGLELMTVDDNRGFKSILKWKEPIDVPAIDRR
ncbi:HAMP domain-containing protein [Paenibacillus sp. LMG 31456]|uniref:HAMP domain-containing protein n=1 Tax=Paenibacillus foliorum TaxID=2654974 RepID=A0A972GUS0_9BACL|nr:HAMP domain-containing protein [Paenibacillus foliorum]